MVASIHMRFLFILLVAIVVAGVTYPFTGNFALFVEAALWIYSLVVAFLIDKAMARRRELKASVNVELARLRHIHHVGEQLPKAFSKKVDALLVAYQRKIEEEFVSHHKSTESFRALSHAIYSFSPRTRREEILYADLLQTLQDLTLGRQKIQFQLLAGLAAYDWFLLTVILACLLTLLFVPTDHLVPLARLAIAFITALVVLLPMEMLWKGDHYSAEAIRGFQDMYGRNVPGRKTH